MSVASGVKEAGGIATFNIEHGFPEAVVRGFRSGFLTDYDYHHLTQCETLDGALLVGWDGMGWGDVCGVFLFLGWVGWGVGCGGCTTDIHPSDDGLTGWLADLLL